MAGEWQLLEMLWFRLFYSGFRRGAWEHSAISCVLEGVNAKHTIISNVLEGDGLGWSQLALQSHFRCLAVVFDAAPEATAKTPKKPMVFIAKARSRAPDKFTALVEASAKRAPENLPKRSPFPNLVLA